MPPAPPSPPVTPSRARDEAEHLARSLLQPVVNATGVLLHTNLGRAPTALDLPAAYRNLELDLTSGTRGSRQAHAGALLARACGAESAMAVNNGAAAVLLVLAALARGRGVVVSRGELVEIGGRLPGAGGDGGVRGAAGGGGYDQPDEAGRLRAGPGRPRDRPSP